MANHVPLLAVVDDDAEVRVALTRLVSSAGFGVETFASGAEFLRSIENHEPDCVVLDLHMPEMSGFEVQAALAMDHAAVPVVVITGHDTPESRARALNLGAKVYLCKPVNDDALLAALITGRNDHSAGFGQVAETATGLPSNDSIIAPASATVGISPIPITRSVA
ncbi:MAG TPA: response regulator [Burkholderiales bacterium]